jgi:hypothetical protein
MRQVFIAAVRQTAGRTDCRSVSYLKVLGSTLGLSGRFVEHIVKEAVTEGNGTSVIAVLWFTEHQLFRGLQPKNKPAT